MDDILVLLDKAEGSPTLRAVGLGPLDAEHVCRKAAAEIRMLRGHLDDMNFAFATIESFKGEPPQKEPDNG